MYLAPRLLRAARVLAAGGVITYPTEGVYGLGCRPDDGWAVARLLALKGRSQTPGLILIAAHWQQLAGWIEPDPGEIARLKSPGPEPVTWVVRAGPLAPQWITGGRSTVAVRVTSHPVAAGLCLALGLPLVSTSANRHGRPAARNAVAARLRFGRDLDLVVGGATGGAPGPTEIREARTGRVLRPGSGRPVLASS